MFLDSSKSRRLQLHSQASPGKHSIWICWWSLRRKKAERWRRKKKWESGWTQVWSEFCALWELWRGSWPGRSRTGERSRETKSDSPCDSDGCKMDFVTWGHDWGWEHCYDLSKVPTCFWQGWWRADEDNTSRGDREQHKQKETGQMENTKNRAWPN